MLGISFSRRQAEALESIARSSERIAGSMEVVAEANREETRFWRSFFGLFSRGQDSSEANTRSHRGGGGGLSDHSRNIPPLPPKGPSGVAMLPGERPCINVTPAKVPQKKGRLW